MIIIKYRILKSGDVGSNPGLQIFYKLITQLFIRYKRKLKFIHINCQSLNKKRDTLKELMGDLGKNAIYRITETRLGELDEAKLWEMRENFKFIRCDRKLDFKERDGGVMLAVSKSLNPKERKDLNYLDKNAFESIWIECRTTNSSATKNNQLNNISYNPHKHYYRQFQEKFSTTIYYANTEKRLVVLGDYNINFLNNSERECLETILIPYGLIEDKPIGHRATSIISDFQMNTNKKIIG